MLKIRFVSRSEFKIQEVRDLLSQEAIEIIPVRQDIEEIQTDDSMRLVKEKALKAFQKISRPLFIEHTGLHIDQLNGLPGGLTQIFWHKLQADKFAALLGQAEDRSALARTVIGYVDGKQFYSFVGEVQGSIAPEPRGNRDFQWDCVFIPEGQALTFAELGEAKHALSMRKLALDKFAAFLRKRGMV